ncbi:hypothetical protein Hanom_Chr14g01254471 [Helianthus anomalus]
MIVFKPPHLGSAQGTSSGTVEEIQQLQQLESSSFIESSMPGRDFCGSFARAVAFLNAMKEVDDAEIDKIPSEPKTADLENVEEIVFEGDVQKSSYV